MPTFTFDHVHLRTPDPEATAQWFERMFGAEIIRSTMLGKPRVDIKLGGAMIFTAQVNPGDGVNPCAKDALSGARSFWLGSLRDRRRRRRSQEKRRRVHPGTALAAARHKNMFPATGHFDRTA
jgi:catechol 2,3-dioxygenase-like lactoylglutathione lyase family enzyme